MTQIDNNGTPTGPHVVLNCSRRNSGRICCEIVGLRNCSHSARFCRIAENFGGALRERAEWDRRTQEDGDHVRLRELGCESWTVNAGPSRCRHRRSLQETVERCGHVSIDRLFGDVEGGCCLLVPCLVLVELRFENHDRPAEFVYGMYQQIDVVEVLRTREAVGQVVARVHGHSHFATVRTEENRK